MLRRNAESIICILILGTVGSTVGPPIPFSKVNSEGKLIEEAHQGPNTNHLSYKRSFGVGGLMAKAHPASSELWTQATLHSSSFSLPWGFWLRDQNSKLQSGCHFRLSGLTTHSEVQDFFHIWTLKWPSTSHLNLSEPQVSHHWNGETRSILPRCWTQRVQHRQVMLLFLNKCTAWIQRQHRANQHASVDYMLGSKAAMEPGNSGQHQ